MTASAARRVLRLARAVDRAARVLALALSGGAAVYGPGREECFYALLLCTRKVFPSLSVSFLDCATERALRAVLSLEDPDVLFVEKVTGGCWEALAAAKIPCVTYSREPVKADCVRTHIYASQRGLEAAYFFAGARLVDVLRLTAYEFAELARELETPLGSAEDVYLEARKRLSVLARTMD